MEDPDLGNFSSARGGKDSPDQVRMDQAIKSLAQSHQCRVARFGGGGWPSWEIKVIEPDGIRSTLVAGYEPVTRKINLFDDRGHSFAQALLKLLQSSFDTPDAQIVVRRRDLNGKKHAANVARARDPRDAKPPGPSIVSSLNRHRFVLRWE